MKKLMESLFALSILFIFTSCFEENRDMAIETNTTNYSTVRLGNSSVYYLGGGFNPDYQGPPGDCPKGGSSCATKANFILTNLASGMEYLQNVDPTTVLAGFTIDTEVSATIEMIAFGEEYVHKSTIGDVLEVGGEGIVFSTEISNELGYNAVKILPGEYLIEQKTEPVFWNGQCIVDITLE